MQRGARARSTKQKAHIQRYEALRDMDAPEFDKQVEMESVSSRLGRTTVEVKNLCKAYGSKVLLKDFTYIFLKNDRVGIIGKKRKRQIYPDEDDCRMGGAGWRNHRDRADSKDGIFFPGK